MSTTPDNVVKLEVPSFDLRMVHQNLSSGLVTAKEYKKHLAALEDLTGEAEEILIDLDEVTESDNDNDNDNDDKSTDS